MSGPADFLSTLESRCRAAAHDGPGDAAHDPSHIERVVANARRLAEVEGARTEVVMPAAWLHDCVHVPKDSPDRKRASRLAAERAAGLLAGWGVDATRVAEIAHAIEAHSFTAGIPPRTLEAKVVQDADRLDAVGAVGLARCLMLGGAMGRPLYDADDPFCESRPADDARSSLDHFYTKLLHLAGTMQTATGRAEAERRTAYLRGFLAELRREIGAPRHRPKAPAPAARGGPPAPRDPVSWHVYLLQCADGTLYSGISNDVARRVAQHNDGKGARYTRGRLPVVLVYQEPAPSKGDALRREAAIKRLSRAAKLRLIPTAGP